MAAPQYLLDTAILMHLIRNDELGKFANAKYQLVSQLYRPFISIVTRGEIKSFAIRRGWSSLKLSAMDGLLENLVTIDISHPEIIEAYGNIDCSSLRSGKRMGKNDIWIAATAHASAATLITTDTDFDHLDPAFVSRIWINPEDHRVTPIKE